MAASLFSKSNSIKASSLASSLSTTLQGLYGNLNILDNIGIISFQKAIEKETVKLAAPRAVAENLILNYKMINESYINSHRKLNL